MWQVIEKRSTQYFVRCGCGTEKWIGKFDLIKGKSKMCRNCSSRKTATRHGYTGTRIHRIWKGMRSRCMHKSRPDFKYYGGRGIKVCDLWNSFENFFADMGQPPSNKHSIDRINVNGDYTLENCRWATQSEQNNNKRPYKKRKGVNV